MSCQKILVCLMFGVLDVLHVAASAADACSGDDSDPPQQPQLVNVRRVLGFLGPLQHNSRRRRAPQIDRRTVLDRQRAAQMITFNRTGQARTQDHIMVHSHGIRTKAEKARRLRVKGTGRSGFRKWTPEAILKTAFFDLASTSRAAKPSGGSPASVGYARAIVAGVIHKAQQAGLQNLVARSRQRKLKYFISNTMSDETKLPFGRPARTRPCLAWHSQCTWADADGQVDDVDVVRAPQLLSSYSAAVVWKVTSDANDVAGILPCEEASPSATYRASLCCFDSHSVNRCISKHAAAALPANHFYIGSYCTQHKTGSVCEEVAKRWGLLPPSLCLANLMSRGDFTDDLEKSFEWVLGKYLHCTATEPPPMTEEDMRQCDFAKELLKICHVQRQSMNDHNTM